MVRDILATDYGRRGISYQDLIKLCVATRTPITLEFARIWFRGEPPTPLLPKIEPLKGFLPGEAAFFFFGVDSRNQRDLPK